MEIVGIAGYGVAVNQVAFGRAVPDDNPEDSSRQGIDVVSQDLISLRIIPDVYAAVCVVGKIVVLNYGVGYQLPVYPIVEVIDVAVFYRGSVVSHSEIYS